MKFFGIFWFVFFSYTAFAAAEPSSTNSQVIQQPIEKLALRICGAMVPGPTDPPIIEGVKKEVVSYMERNGIPNPSNAQIVGFLNNKRHQLICKIEGKSKHYMKFAIDRGAHSDIFIGFFIEDLMADQDKMININAITENSAGNPETVLDYLDHLLATEHFPAETLPEIRSFRTMLYEDFEARNYYSLNAQTK